MKKISKNLGFPAIIFVSFPAMVFSQTASSYSFPASIYYTSPSYVASNYSSRAYVASNYSSSPVSLPAAYTQSASVAGAFEQSPAPALPKTGGGGGRAKAVAESAQANHNYGFLLPSVIAVLVIGAFFFGLIKKPENRFEISN